MLLDNLLFELSSPLRTQVLLILSIFICAFLLLFQPFNLDSASLAEQVITALGTAFTFFLVGWGLNNLRAAGLWPAQGKPIIAELLYVTSYVCIVGLTVYGFRLNSEYVDFTLASALQFQLFALMSALVIVFISRLLTALMKLSGGKQTRTELEGSLNDLTDTSIISLQTATGEENFSFPFEKWVAAKSAGNYLELYFHTSNKKPVVLVRSTLKQLNIAMQFEPSFYQCHRSHAVNLDHVENLHGRAQGYKLIMRGHFEPVPVSRNAEKVLLSKLR